MSDEQHFVGVKMALEKDPELTELIWLAVQMAKMLETIQDQQAIQREQLNLQQEQMQIQ